MSGPNDHGKSTPPEPVAPFAGLPTLPLPPGRPPRRPWFLVSVPALALGVLAVLAVVAGLLLISPLSPWSRSPVESPLDGDEPGLGVFGTGAPGVPGVSGAATIPGGGPGPGATAGSTVGPTVTGGAGATSDPGATPPATGSAGTTTTATVPAPRITGFATRQIVGGLLGYEIDLSIMNDASIAQTWGNASAYINGVPLGVTVAEPRAGVRAGVRAFLASDRVCVEPIDTATRNLDPNESQPITLTLTMVSLGQAPRPGTVNDSQCPASAES